MDREEIERKDEVRVKKDRRDERKPIPEAGLYMGKYSLTRTLPARIEECFL